ncbi:MAG: enoyl-[acyl-carrier protein] reductase II [Candidatus Azotimanducaceae bacterium]|jgi:enoyl-[acyl-carrier protein] reductase II|tara:strand:- start:7133 stop:7327 length:195 start_codon:yes stop_codon:yes gene_type:complete
MLGVELPIVQAPVGWVGCSQSALAAPNTDAKGIIELSSGELDVVREEIFNPLRPTGKPSAANVA